MLSLTLFYRKGLPFLNEHGLFVISIYTNYFTLSPKLFMLDNTIQSIGKMFNNFFSMTLNLGSINNETFPQDWTVFYWAWWIGYASLIGMFTARISRGRPIRQVILIPCLVGPIGTWIFFGIFGNYALNLELSNILQVGSILESSGQTEAIMAVTNTLPYSMILIPLLIIAYLVFSATTFDSASLILASVASKKLDKA